MEIKIYLKGVKKPLIFEIDEVQLESLYKQLLTRDVIKFGSLIFQRQDLLYIIEN